LPNRALRNRSRVEPGRVDRSGTRFGRTLGLRSPVMATPTPLESHAADFRRLLAGRIGEQPAFDMPGHLLVRLTVLLHGQAVEYVLFHPAHLDGGGFSGTFLLLTERVVVRAEVSSSQDGPSPLTEPSARVEMWSRATLARVLVEDEQPGMDRWWQQYSRDAQQQWPRATAVTLTYRDRPEPLRLPLGERQVGDKQADVLATLLRDLEL
jgi:hypothetical protein